MLYQNLLKLLKLCAQEATTIISRNISPMANRLDPSESLHDMAAFRSVTHLALYLGPSASLLNALNNIQPYIPT